MTQQICRTRIKICGFTQPADARAAAYLGADAIGMVFYPKSKRYVNAAQAQSIANAVPAFVNTVALFVNAEPQFVKSIVDAIKPSFLQFHGEETASYCASFNYPYIKAFRVGAPSLDNAANLALACKQYESAAAWLFDSYTQAYGGSGTSFDDALLSQIPRGGNTPEFILSGGLNIASVASRIAKNKPFAVDVSSAVELAPGQKDSKKMQDFINAVHDADYSVK